ncbi:cytochrome C [Winogradskyella sp. J14-2]|uniref:c-type cytochrome n=1 Tax=Winogradskyella sp. J14-2 TaxID=1936080 RepID=UPI0009728B35|nr:cytochrome c [Winogradskyella sp. J14-2]APY09665.1 cytochrome C [Winogradskyella sp. J14-2]
MKTSFKYIIVIVILVSFVSCQKNSRPNYQYMPNMYESVGYEAYQESDAFANGIEAQLPANGTIPRGDFMPYEIEDTNEGYEKAKATLRNPLADPIPLDMADSIKVDPNVPRVDYAVGGPLYTIYCVICHGVKGDGKGKLVEREKILGVPSYDDVGRAITTGSIYHVIYYGKNTMGSYANQLNEEERWQVVAYVEKLKADLEK